MDSLAPCLCLVASCTFSAAGHCRLPSQARREVVGSHPRIVALRRCASPPPLGSMVASVPAHRPRRSGMVARGRSPPRRAVARRGGGRIGRVCLDWLLRASSPRARAALVHVVAFAYPVLLLRCDVTRAGSEGPVQLPRRTRPLLSCVELHHVAAGGHPRSPTGSWNITSWRTRRLLAGMLRLAGLSTSASRCAAARAEEGDRCCLALGAALLQISTPQSAPP